MYLEALISNIGLLTAYALTGKPYDKEPNFNKYPLAINDEFDTICIGDFCVSEKQWSTAG